MFTGPPTPFGPQDRVIGSRYFAACAVAAGVGCLLEACRLSDDDAWGICYHRAMTAHDPRDLWRVQLKLECKAFDDVGLLVTVPCADPDPLATGHVVRYCDGSTEVAFTATAPEWFVQQISRHNIDEIVNQPAVPVEQLQADGRSIELAHFHTYCFGDEVTAAEHPAITRDSAEAYSIAIDGQSVARASSSRSNDEAAELWIETDPAHRRRGYATSLARAWATGVRHAGKTAFYSHLHDNAASAALARHLRVSPLFEIIAITLN